MNINAEKINVLEGAWVDSFYHKAIYPQFENASIPIFRQQVLPLLRIFDETYWANLRAAHKIHFACIDPHHWGYDDAIFGQYVERISSVFFPVVCLFESPYGLEMPSVETVAFSEKLFERTTLLVNAIKEKHPSTIILSPAIQHTKEMYLNYYLDYFVQNRSLFDGYAVHCCNDMSEYALRKITSFLEQLMKAVPKKIWITKWGVPTHEGTIINAVVGPSDSQPLDYKVGYQRLQRSFAVIDSLASQGSHWFYTAIGKDSYNPHRKPSPSEFWNPDMACVTPNEYSYAWQFRHFLGLATSDGKIKSSLIENFTRFAKSKNNTPRKKT
jgi:hypothetical protein